MATHSTSAPPAPAAFFAFDILAKGPRGKVKARAVIDGKLKAPSGFAIGPDGDFYVAERRKQRVRRFSPKGKKKGTFIAGLPDMPEFLVHVPDRPQPRCLGHRKHACEAVSRAGSLT